MPEANPNCEKCHGEGKYRISKPGLQFMQQVVCGCVPPPTLEDRIRPYFREIVGTVVPAKYRNVKLKDLQPSEKSRLPLPQQVALYDELRANPLCGWAFFAPAGYSKTTCSYALYKRALIENLARWIQKGQGLGSYDYRPDPNGSQYSLRSPRIFVWRKSVPDLLQQHFDRMNMKDGENATYVPKPEISVENIEKAVQKGYCPRVFLEEIDKIKPSEYAVNQLFRIFDALDRHQGQIVLDTNLSKEQFQNMFGDMIARRIKENCTVKEFGF